MAVGKYSILNMLIEANGCSSRSGRVLGNRRRISERADAASRAQNLTGEKDLCCGVGREVVLGVGSTPLSCLPS